MESKPCSEHQIYDRVTRLLSKMYLSLLTLVFTLALQREEDLNENVNLAHSILERYLLRDVVVI